MIDEAEVAIDLAVWEGPPPASGKERISNHDTTSNTKQRTHECIHDSEPSTALSQLALSILPIVQRRLQRRLHFTFFAAAGVRLLDPEFLLELESQMGSESKMVHGFMDALLAGADLHCSFGSVKATLGHSEGDGALYVPDDNISWSGPPGVVALSVASDVQLMY